MSDPQRRSRSPPGSLTRQDTIVNEAIEQLSAGLTRVHIAGVQGSTIRKALRTRPDLFIIEDRVSARGKMAFNVRFTEATVWRSLCSPSHDHPVGHYHRAINPFKDGRI